MVYIAHVHFAFCPEKTIKSKFQWTIQTKKAFKKEKLTIKNNKREVNLVKDEEEYRDTQ